MEDVIEHFSDGQPVALPYAYAGHYPADSDAASPLIAVLYGADPAGHPFRPDSPLLLAETEDGLVGRVLPG